MMTDEQAAQIKVKIEGKRENLAARILRAHQSHGRHQQQKRQRCGAAFGEGDPKKGSKKQI